LNDATTGEAKLSTAKGLSVTTYLLELVALTVAYFGFAEVSVFVPVINPAATPLWPPTGLALALILLRGYRIWPAIVAGSFAFAALTAHPWMESGAVATAAVLGALAGAWLLDQWSGGRDTFSTPLGIAKFALVSFVPTALLSTAIAAAWAVFGSNDLSLAATTTLPSWWLADAAGVMLITPPVVLWAMTPFRSLSARDFAETAAICAVAAVIGFAAYSPAITAEQIGDYLSTTLPYRGLLGFLVVLPLMWAGLRGNRANAATAALCFCAMAFWGYSAGIGPFPRGDVSGALLLFVLAAATSLPSLALAAATVMRQNTEARLVAKQEALNVKLKETNVALESAKRHFQILIEGVVDYAVFVLDTSGRVASWNSAAQKIIGYSADEIIGKHFGIFYRPDERRAGEPNRALELAVQNGKCDVEGWRIRKNGTLVFVTGSVSVIRDNSGNLVGFANIIRDATERRDAQEKLVQAREQLAMAQKMEAIGKLTGGIAHDFNNLLMIIGGNAQTFKRLLDPKLPKAIEAIQAAASRGESLTRQLLTFSRRQQLSPTVVDLADCIRNMRTMIESSLRGNIVYNETISPGVWSVKVDQAELELAIVNIAVNARDAMPSGGTFTLSVAPVAPTAIGDDQLEGDFVGITFTDTGTGVPPNLLSKIFDPFFTTKEVGKGTGLGLSQVYGFAHQAGGTVRAESKVGQGTTITIYLPSSAEKKVAARETARERAKPPRPTVLVVDDSAEVAQVTSSLFEHLGYETVYRDSAEAALKLLEDGKKFDLVFSDIVMPGTIDGVGLASEIRSRYPDLQVILTTGYSDAAQSAPPDLPILRKPFDTDALRDFIADAGSEERSTRLSEFRVTRLHG
jgi:PAS domain S-box-containing protein